MTPAYDRELIARMLEEYRAKLPAASSSYSAFAITDQIRLLREADNAEAASVGTVAASEDGLQTFAREFEHAIQNGIMDDGDGDGPTFYASQEWAMNMLEKIRRLAASGQGVEELARIRDLIATAPTPPTGGHGRVWKAGDRVLWRDRMLGTNHEGVIRCMNPGGESYWIDFLDGSIASSAAPEEMSAPTQEGK